MVMKKAEIRILPPNNACSCTPAGASDLDLSHILQTVISGECTPLCHCIVMANFLSYASLITIPIVGTAPFDCWIVFYTTPVPYAPHATPKPRRLAAVLVSRKKEARRAAIAEGRTDGVSERNCATRDTAG